MRYIVNTPDGYVGRDGSLTPMREDARRFGSRRGAYLFTEHYGYDNCSIEIF